MPIDPAVRAALRRFERRAVVVSFVTTASVALAAVALAAELAWLSGDWNTIAISALAVIAVAGSAIYAATGRPTPATIARHIDARAGLNDLVVTAVDCGGDGMPALVRRRSLEALARESPARAFPLRAPRHWRRWLLSAAVVQLAAVPIALRAPARRDVAQGLSALSLPPAPGGASASAGNGQQSAAPNPAAPGASPNAVAAAAEATHAGTARAAEAVTPNARDAAGAASNGPDDRLRLAVANAGADIAAGRVPLARRAMVERYFAALQSQKRRPR